MNSWTVVVMLATLLLLNAVLAGGEISLISLRGSQIRRAAESSGARGRALARLADDPNRFLATIQIGITAAGFLASATAAITLAEPLVPALAPLGDAAEPVAVTLVTALLTFVTLVVGELTPKRLALAAPLPWALAVARPLELLSRASRPLVWALGAATDGLVRLLGGRAGPAETDLAPDDLRDLITGHRGLNPLQRRIILGALELHRHTLRQVVVPRRQVFSVPATWTVEQAREALARAGHSRAPLVGPRGLDDVRGLVSLRGLQDAEGSLPDVATEAPVWPDTVRVAEALRRFRAERRQFALVGDEYGGVIGIVTLEDLLEEVVGEIYDETDPDLAGVQHAGEVMTVPGTFAVHDLPDLGVELREPPRGDYATVAGLVLAALGHLPEQPGDRVGLDGWVFEVAAVERHAVTAVRVMPDRDAGRHGAGS